MAMGGPEEHAHVGAINVVDECRFTQDLQAVDAIMVCEAHQFHCDLDSPHTRAHP